MFKFRNRIRIVFSLLLFAYCGISLSQNSNKNWCFGNSVGLDFNLNPPTTFSTAMYAYEGSSSISDNAGNLLFYTNGFTVYNRLHQVMANGTGLNGDPSSTQSSVILKLPNSQSLYYVITTNAGTSVLGNNRGAYYTIIDMALAAGNGSVISKNNLLQAAPVTEKLAATKHCNGVDFWIVTHQDSSNIFKVNLLTAQGISTLVSTNAVGSIFNGNTINGSAGQMKVSTNGRKIVCSYQSAGNPITGGYEIFDFDNSTGLISNPFTIPAQYGPYGCEFSPDGSKFYASFNISATNSGILQWDLCAGNTNAIISSQIVVGTVFVPISLQLAPNGKIYVARSLQSSLSVINNPNITGIGCNFQANAVTFATNASCWGLPNMVYSAEIPTVSPFTAVASTSCQIFNFNSPVVPGFIGGNCPASSFSLVGITWDFGDPASGVSNTSSLVAPSHSFTSVGNYTVNLCLDYGCGYGKDTIKQIVSVTNSCFVITSNSITCASLGSATVTPPPTALAYTYSWIPTPQTGSVATNLAPGQYTILVYDPIANFTHTLLQTFISPIPLTGSLLNANSIACNAAATGTAQFTNLQGGSANQNYLWTNGTQSYTTAFTNSLSAGIWSVNVTDALTGCQINQSFFISQPPPLSPTLTISTPTICAGASAILSATNSGGTPAYTYTFINGPISFSSTITESISGTHVYAVQSTDANNCLSSATVSLDVIANPILNVSSVSICPTAIANFTVSGAAGYTLSSTPLGLTVFAAPSPTAVASFTDAPLSNTIYTLTGTALGCTSSTTTSVFIYTSPTPIISSNSPKCEGSSAVISVSGGTASVWSGPNIFSSNNVSNTITPIGLSNAGVYSTTITSAVGCTATASSSFVVNPTPTLSVAGSTVCTTQTMALFANAMAGSSYQWFGLNNYSSTVQNPTLANPTLNRTGSYTVIVTAPTSCTNTAIAQVSVTTPPSLSIALSSNSLCAQAFNGSPNTITLTSSGAHTYTLYTPNLLGSSTPVAPSASLFATPPFASTLAAGIATLQGSNGVCTSTSSFVFTVVPNPTVGVNSFTPVICAGKNFTYTSNGASSYVWSATSPNYTTYSNGGVAVAHPSINAVFSVYGSSLGCQSALVSSSITVFPLPTITLSALSSSICLYDKTNLSVSGTGTSFQWLPLTGLNAYTGSLVNCGTQVNQVYTVIASANNCTAAATTSIHVWPLPTAKITGTTSSVCLNDTIRLSAEGGVQFNWFGPGNIAVGGQSASINAWSPNVGGTYTLVVTDINSCKNATTTNISILALPDGSLKTFKEEVCAPYCTTYNFEGFGSKTIQSTWVINSSTITSNVFSTCFKEAGTYTLQGKLFDNATSCKSEISYVVNVRPKPSADFLFLPRTPIENLDEVVFNNTSSGEGLLTYHWYFNDNKGFSTTNKNTSYLYSEPGDYRVVLVAKNNFNCADTILKIIRVEPDFALYVPNTFTPNDDSRNDVFLASVRSSKLFDLKIYDRWGAEIFHAKSPNDGWDGTFRGTACKQDTYTWVIELSTVGGERVVKSGTVVLLR